MQGYLGGGHQAEFYIIAGLDGDVVGCTLVGLVSYDGGYARRLIIGDVDASRMHKKPIGCR